MSFTQYGSKYSASKKLMLNAPEDVTVKLYPTQIVYMIIPHGTNRSGEIRTHMRSKVRTEEGNEIFVFRDVDNSWSTACRSSTPSAPVLAVF